MQDAGHPRAEAFGDALASCPGACLPGLLPAGAGSECRNRGAGHPDASCPDQSGRFDSAWELLSGICRREVAIPDNVAPFPCKRAA